MESRQNKWILEELRQEQAASLNTDYVEELFEIYLLNNAESN